MIDDYESFKSHVLAMTKIDLNAYKEGQMKRRIDTLITKCKCSGYSQYIDLLKHDNERYEEFVNYLTINVSEFWRNPDQWKVLEDMVVPELIKKPSMKIWSAACSTGDEPYSLVMLLAKYVPMSRIKIIATDIDKQVLAKAKSGLYIDKSLKGLPNEFKTKYFDELADNTFAVKDEVKRCVEFREHNLLRDPYPSPCDLIVCRNVLIYFTEEAKDDIYVKFHNALNPEGVLFLGSTEQIIQPAKVGFKSISSFFYRRLD